MRILHITTSGPNAGGVTEYIRRLSKATVEAGCEVSVAGRVPEAQTGNDAVEWLDANTDGGLRDLWQSSRSLAAAGRYDLVHTHYRKAALVGRRVARRLKIPMLFTLHLTGIPMDILHRAMSDFGDLTHAPSLKAKDWLIQCARLSETKIVTIPHGIDPLQFPLATQNCQRSARASIGLPLDGTVAAYVGRFEHPKNEGWIVELAQMMPSVEFVMMGSGPRQGSLRGAPVTLLPFGNPLPVYQAADILLLPSSLEGFSFVAAEAMSVGRPVLRTRTAGVDEMIIEGVTGFSCAIDRDSFLKLAREVLVDRERLISMGSAAAAHVRKHLTHTTQVDRTLALYKSMIKG